MRKPLLFLLVGMLGVALFGCIGEPTPSPTASPTATIEAENVVEIRDGSFYPGLLAIEVGEEVTWRNTGSESRVLYFIDLESPVINPGDSWARSFYDPLEHTYRGEPWSESFKGVVQVS